MSFKTPIWTREQSPFLEREAEAYWVCFSVGDLADDIPLEVDAFGVPSTESAKGADVRKVTREEDPEWFDNWRAGAVRNIASRDLGQGMEALDAADQCHTIRCAVVDPSDLAYLQSGWALARWLVVRGVCVVLDVHAMRFLPSDAVASVPPDNNFDLKREVSIILETDQRPGSPGHALHTRGMRKLGRPDLVCWVQPADAPEMGEVMRQLCQSMAAGWMPGARHCVNLDGERQLYLEPYQPLPEDDLHLNNDGLHLVAGEGEPEQEPA